MDNKTVYLNGRYLPIHEAHISVLDRGFLFGDGVYEVIPSYSGRLFRFQDHIRRLSNSLSGIRLNNPHNEKQWLDIVSPLIDPRINQSVYIQITRGADEKRDHAFPKSTQPTVFAMSSPVVPVPGQHGGIKAITLPDERWQNCHIKAVTLLANILNRQQALDRGCTEAILYKNGHVTEGSASNVFAVIDNILLTPPKSNEILPGITRDVILELARSNHIHYQESPIPVEELKKAQEIWICSSIREIMPVVELDSKQVADGRPGPLWQRTNRLFQRYKNSHSHD